MGPLHPLSLTRAVLDPIHGLVRLTEQEVAVLNHPVYQRLRKIKQNGLLHLVFPSATHTRFEHSIGVLFVADSMLRALLFNSDTAAEKGRVQRRKPSAQDGYVVDLNTTARDQLKELFRIARLAALAHDLGHGPLSHTFDNFAPGIDGIVRLLSAPELRALNGFKKVFEEYAQKHHKKGSTLVRVPHEVMSCIFFALIWAKVAPTDIDTPRTVAAAILGHKAFELVGHTIRPWVPLLHDVVASAPADADRMDYLERDSRSCGVSYGLFDRNRLLKTMLCYQVRKKGSAHYRLGLKLSGARAVENFVQARFELFVQVYYHKTNRAIASMLDAISMRASQQGLQIIADDSLDHLVSDYVALGDDYFLDVLRGLHSEHQVTDPDINATASKIHNRELWTRVFDLQEMGGVRGVTGTAVFKHLKAKTRERDLLVDAVSPGATKDLNTGAAILRQDANGAYVAATGLKWEEVSPIIKALAKQEKSLYRVFVKSDDENRARRIRAEARRIASALWEGRQR